MNRVTLNDLNHIPLSTPITQTLQLAELFICDQNIYAISEVTPQILMKYTIKNFTLADTIQINQLKLLSNKRRYHIKSLNQLGSIIAFSIYLQNQYFDEDCNKLFYIINKQVYSIFSHMASINQIMSFQNKYFISCSQDLTIRVWKILQKEVVPNPMKHALPFHKDEVTCLQNYQNCLISGSKDSSIAFWINFQLFCNKKLIGKIIKIQQCPQSEQLAVFIQKGSQLEIHTISMVKVLKYKNLEIIKVINCGSINFDNRQNILVSSQIDDSFLVFTTSSRKNNIQKQIKQGLIFVQINLGKIISVYPKDRQEQENQQNKQDLQQKQMGKVQKMKQKWSNILDVKCLGRIILIGRRRQNIQLLRI